jgi:hypothetical protein
MNSQEKSINPGETLLSKVKAISGGKYQLEFAELIQNPTAKGGNSLVGLLNKSDDRFASAKPRRAWISGEKSDIEGALGFKIEDMEPGDDKFLNIVNPEIGGDRVRVQITETTVGSEYQLENLEKSAKRAGADGDYITHGGEYVFSNTDPVIGKAKHTFLASDSVAAAVQADVAEDGLEA